MALGSYGLQCLTWILTAAAMAFIVIVLLVGIGRLLSDGIEVPEDI